ncbi:type II toxin-antitoxin system RelE/ParE family toxin [Flavobacterium sp. Fl-77]|uniref:Type II toxin-antitoxin system RelE/ParE family toxin n=1 Tax=Flavobacterium flavipigmentatum TaxID=2893884 RepID=A0AAJ2VVZ5_9FLAO|nr:MULTISPECIES: type II toxin-antitoxin system RelE/ParE family toxin [unclassified Flavobacterium]MDX6181644.1 type II toxin-antitoxin system RelE/ParE family toxin [Flavobacterium sp. Fl-33]MDX6185322.1 type II toxin-antitoxin system RelE/ParE family toxin [Flavobacterium sp. Fl-77]UFH37427.1 type II toxin-antitoxin system RelE/ParE family toxin [Flavobacterium sp. F-70]
MTIDFNYDLNNIVHFISKDKPIAARKFKNDLIEKIKKNLINPFHFKKSIYFEDELYRDYIFKGYTVVVKMDSENETVFVLGILKNKKIF